MKNEALKQAELANTTAIPSLKQEVAQFRKTIETMANQALHFGHPAHLAKYVYPYLFLPLLSFCPMAELETHCYIHEATLIAIYVALGTIGQAHGASSKP